MSLVSLGCESFNKQKLGKVIKASGRPVETLVIQGVGGTGPTIDAGRAFIDRVLPELEAAVRAPCRHPESAIRRPSLGSMRAS